jgi:hypothetical protein
MWLTVVVIGCFPNNGGENMVILKFPKHDLVRMVYVLIIIVLVDILGLQFLAVQDTCIFLKK